MSGSTHGVDVMIVGGGPAGSSVAWGLRNSGLAVAVMDKAAFPRNKVCAGWITPAVVDALELDLGDYARTRTLQPIHAFRVGLIGRETVDIHYDGRPVSYGIRRCEFDEYLLRRCGAELRLGQGLKSMSRTATGWLINGEVRARIVIGAGGHFCPVARALGAKLGQGETAVTAQEVEFEMTPAQRAGCPVRAEAPELYFCPDLKGYGWIFRKDDWLNVGLGREDNHRLSEQVENFCRWLQAEGRLPADMPTRFNGHAYLLSNHATRPILDEGALLVGDASGLAYPQSGEGIRPAIESGLIAAAVVTRAAGDYSAANLAPYVERLAQRFGLRRPRAVAPERKSPLAAKQLLARALLATRWFNRHFVVERWFLHRHERTLDLA